MACDVEFHSEGRREASGAEALIHIRPFDRMYEAEVRDLFARCIREIAPPSVRAQAETYIAEALTVTTATLRSNTGRVGGAASGSPCRGMVA